MTGRVETLREIVCGAAYVNHAARDRALGAFDSLAAELRAVRADNQRLRELLEEYKLTTLELAAALGKTYPAVRPPASAAPGEGDDGKYGDHRDSVSQGWLGP